MQKEKIVNELLRSTYEKGLIKTLHSKFGKSINVSISFSTKDCDKRIDDVEFSPRAEHALKRAGIFTIGGVIDIIIDDSLLKIKNLGKKTQNEIKTRILNFGYENLSKNEKKRFFYDLLEKNVM